MNSPADLPRLEKSALRLPLPKAGKAEGFTMIELAVVLAVIGVVAALTAGVYMNWTDFHRFSSAVSTLDSSLRAARLRAIGRQATLQMRFAPMTQAELAGASFPPYGKDGFQVVYPEPPGDYSKMVFAYDPAVFTVAVSADGVAVPDQDLTSATDVQERTIGFNSRGIAVTYNSAALDDPTQRPFRFSIKAANLREDPITFTVSPVGKITRP